jgi:hypothetical protein
VIPEKFISGGQTGADQAGLDYAISRGIPHGGNCPKGRMSERGPIPDKYDLTETMTAQYPPRTAMNIQKSDGTVIFTEGLIDVESGCALTARLCVKYHKPYMAVDLSRDVHAQAAKMLREFVAEKNIKVLNVAGSRASKAPGIHQKVLTVLELAFDK